MATRKAQRPPVPADDTTPEIPKVIDLLIAMKDDISSIKERMARVEEKADGIIDRQDKANGSIARHDKLWLELKTKGEANNKWLARLEKLAWASGGVILYFVLRNGPAIAGLFFRN